MPRRRSTRVLRPALERLDEKCLPGAGPRTAHFAPLRAAHQHQHHPQRIAPSHLRGIPPRLPILAIAPGPPGGLGPPSGTSSPPPTAPLGTLTLVPDVGTLVPPFGQYLAASSRPVPGAVYNLSFLTVRNGTSRAFDWRSGFSVDIVGQGGFQPFLPKGYLWNPGGVIVFYTLTADRFPGSFTFDFNGSIQERPNNIDYNIQYSPTTFPGTLDAIAARSLGAHYRLV